MHVYVYLIMSVPTVFLRKINFLLAGNLVKSFKSNCLDIYFSISETCMVNGTKNNV